jgi:hypothetical protein
MKWIAVRQRSSANHGTWDYMQVPDWCKNARDVEEYMDDRHMLSNWSEHYRGIEVKFVKKVPQRVLDQEIKHVKNQLEYYKERLKELEAMKPGKVDLREQQRKQYARRWNKMCREKGYLHLLKEV